jgi:Na+/H+ antiporter NhaD/arsenite permease-like protein
MPAAADRLPFDMNSHTSPTTSRRVAWAILGLLAAYFASAAPGLAIPQRGRDAVLKATQHAAQAPEAAAPDDEALEEAIHAPPLWTVLPFVGLLLAIAAFPLIPWTQHWWESNLHRFYAAAALAVVTLAYYLVLHEGAIEGHWPAHHVVAPGAGLLQVKAAWTIVANAIFSEFVPFIVLLFSLYTISGGIRIEGDLLATPLTNVKFMATGGVLASFIGTTGAAMLLVRPLLDTNGERRHVKHTVIFFIFIVCNCGGCLLPIGDPPLFLGYLRGVPFTWTLGLWPKWLFVNGFLLGVYWMLDHFVFFRRETPADKQRDVAALRRLQIRGLGVGGSLLAGVVLAVALLDPAKPFPGTNWHAWLYLREAVQLALVAIALLAGREAVREANRFNYHAIVEVAALFFGIFICMQPALQILHERGDELGVNTPAEFFWYTGALSSVLDNAPTYAVFFETARVESHAAVEAGAATPGELVPGANVIGALLAAVSLGAVFMGAMTYIGNGPNFMVKAIAEKSGVPMPSFFGYMGYSCVFLLPILALMQWWML